MRDECLDGNEAVLQRSVMMNIFHQYWIQGQFSWNAQQAWVIGEAKRIKTQNRLAKTAEKILRPETKPDLVFAFASSIFEKEVPARGFPPHNLEECMHPDGLTRCFPLLIMEPRKGHDSLKQMETKNLVKASQALYNMYHWMDRAQMREEFFKKVRVFSVVFNAQHLGIRAHRAEPGPDDGELSFKFVDLWALRPHQRDFIWTLINSILREYAAKELQSILVAAVKSVMNNPEAYGRTPPP